MTEALERVVVTTDIEEKGGGGQVGSDAEVGTRVTASNAHSRLVSITASFLLCASTRARSLSVSFSRFELFLSLSPCKLPVVQHALMRKLSPCKLSVVLRAFVHTLCPMRRQHTELDLPVVGEENVLSFNVAVDHKVFVEILQRAHCLMQDICNHLSRVTI